MKGNKPYVVVFIIQAIYAAMFLLSKAAFDHGMNNFIFVFYRQAIATLFLLPFAFFFEWKTAPPLSFLTFCKIFFLSFFGITLSLDIYGIGLIYTTATLAAAATNSLPVITFVLALLLSFFGLWLVLQGIMVTGVTYYLQTWVIEKKGPVFFAMSTPLSLILTILSSALVLGVIIRLGSLDIMDNSLGIRASSLVRKNNIAQQKQELVQNRKLEVIDSAIRISSKTITTNILKGFFSQLKNMLDLAMRFIISVHLLQEKSSLLSHNC
ncbi:hypothetical protein TanjilG_31883 [Lupinus angustifolius]|uniref:WAT1-related protein n=1 Tax=Lupinus angustifolius TaxID=3871 RepID=A0A1J7H3S8_LUPAN|nr:hypothetical protein TanjilG_31883 [Lupinus angustifolius]